MRESRSWIPASQLTRDIVYAKQAGSKRRITLAYAFSRPRRESTVCIYVGSRICFNISAFQRFKPKAALQINLIELEINPFQI